MNGWEIVCPDGKVRHMPYINFGDAECDAKVIYNRNNCRLYKKPSALELQHGPCPNGPHTVVPCTFEMPPERGES